MGLPMLGRIERNGRFARVHGQMMMEVLVLHAVVWIRLGVGLASNIIFLKAHFEFVVATGRGASQRGCHSWLLLHLCTTGCGHVEHVAHGVMRWRVRGLHARVTHGRFRASSWPARLAEGLAQLYRQLAVL